MTADLPDFTNHLDYWLRHASGHTTRALASRLEDSGVTPGEWVLLREIINHEAIAPVRLAAILGVTRANISRLTTALINKRLVISEDDLDNGHARKILTLSTAGRDLVPELARIAQEHDMAFSSSLAADDRKTLERILRSIVAMK